MRAATPTVQQLGDIFEGKEIIVMEEVEIDGVVRAKVGKDSTPRGIALHPLGWVTALKEGEEKLERIAEEEFGGGRELQAAS